MLEVNVQRKRGQPKMTWRRQVEESEKKVGLKIEEVPDRTRWREGMRAITEGMRCIEPFSVTRKKPDGNWNDDDDGSHKNNIFRNTIKSITELHSTIAEKMQSNSKAIVNLADLPVYLLAG